jgi:hypothetical protein
MRLEAGDDALDVVLDIDPGTLLEFALTVFLSERMELSADIGRHHALHVGVSDDGGVLWQVAELGWPDRAQSTSWEPDVVRDEAGADPDTQHQ